MLKNMGKTIHEAPKCSQLWWALVSLTPCFFHESFKISSFDKRGLIHALLHCGHVCAQI